MKLAYQNPWKTLKTADNWAFSEIPIRYVWSRTQKVFQKKLFLMFIYVFWERAQERSIKQAGEGQGERETENPKQAPRCQHRAQCGAQIHKPWDHDLSENQESDA